MLSLRWLLRLERLRRGSRPRGRRRLLVRLPLLFLRARHRRHHGPLLLLLLMRRLLHDALALRRWRRQGMERESTVGLTERGGRRRSRHLGRIVDGRVNPRLGRAGRRHRHLGAASASDRRGRTQTGPARPAGREPCLLGRGDNLVVEDGERGTEDDPFDAVLVSVADALPDGFLLVRPAGDGDASSAAGFGRVLADPAKLDSSRRDQVAGVGKVEH